VRHAWLIETGNFVPLPRLNKGLEQSNELDWIRDPLMGTCDQSPS
jgi:hypothetical protein